ncbi:MAG: hypothetical protein QM621_07290 [Aeromicrobium sp.]|uniref:hypothetical protein n=1 Tax=Aeromicrobium sp. TaxID=1871063 RepID=UPI0039E22457
MPRFLSISVVVVLVVVDLVLLAWLALWMNDQRNTGESTAQPSPATTEGGEETAGTPGGDVRLEYSGGTLIRITQGSCTGETRPMLETSADLGQSYTEMAVPVIDGGDGESVAVSAVLSATAESPTELTILATNGNCEVSQYVTADAGASWSAEPPSGWYIGPTGEEVFGPETVTEPGCVARRLWAFNDLDLKVLCDDLSLRGSSSGGDEWISLGEVTDATDVLMTDVYEGVAVATTPECASQVLVTDDAGSSWEAIGCVSAEARVDHLLGSSSQLIAVGADSTWLSADGGATWAVG